MDPFPYHIIFHTLVINCAAETASVCLLLRELYWVQIRLASGANLAPISEPQVSILEQKDA